MPRVAPYLPPSFDAQAFSCPFCATYATQYWINPRGEPNNTRIANLKLAVCRHCKGTSVWWKEKMIVPPSGNAPLPNPDLPGNVKEDYEEARGIVNASPRGAAALLRLAIQTLTSGLGESGKDLNTDIGNLVKKGLPVMVQEALDTVRVVGNNAVHPGQIDLKDDAATARSLFELVNFIAEKMITEPKEIAALYKRLPKGARDQITKRDGKKQVMDGRSCTQPDRAARV